MTTICKFSKNNKDKIFVQKLGYHTRVQANNKTYIQVIGFTKIYLTNHNFKY